MIYHNDEALYQKKVTVTVYYKASSSSASLFVELRPGIWLLGPRSTATSDSCAKYTADSFSL
ncbi:hypothetical protein RRG08_033978 [Elysia crispata]|uniref:Uncharacterized protein n=1 Tax=Elysia crispata TaxID=231223 RepID=A0AAE0YS44_9GAST|nr:hypothetical protein RRG08_033978 [Elysia crispata]